MEKIEKLIHLKKEIADKIGRIVSGELIDETLEDLEYQWEMIERQIKQLFLNL